VRLHLTEPPRIAIARVPHHALHLGAEIFRQPDDQPRPDRARFPAQLGRRAMKSISMVMEGTMHQLVAASELTMRGQGKSWKRVYGCICVCT